ncbi:hypothetical protein SLEP1_g16023 [Rubroshorea leprosula]|uniref:Uncharacterized protein n=1 Tax=Rubroshorea leprosula TaxID=152421 RepID=A0AAV5IYI8_9ROSI|nr:hypothetical protein SLEP1_g16023 [Rubroshorea leprosula]
MVLLLIGQWEDIAQLLLAGFHRPIWFWARLLATFESQSGPKLVEVRREKKRG